MRKRQGLWLVASLVVLVSLLAASWAEAGWVRGYYRKDGTYVQPHYRTAPDGNPYNNYSFPGNYNPNTGRYTPGDPSTYLDRYYDRSLRNTYDKPYLRYPRW